MSRRRKRDAGLATLQLDDVLTSPDAQAYLDSVAERVPIGLQDQLQAARAEADQIMGRAQAH